MMRNRFRRRNRIMSDAAAAQRGAWISRAQGRRLRGAAVASGIDGRRSRGVVGYACASLSFCTAMVEKMANEL